MKKVRLISIETNNYWEKNIYARKTQGEALADSSREGASQEPKRDGRKDRGTPPRVEGSLTEGEISGQSK